MGGKIDKELNAATKFGAEGDVSTPDSKIRLLVIPTNEELMIARDTYELCK
jgi:acetate kinase